MSESKEVLAIVGSREFTDTDLIHSWLANNHERFAYLVTGGAPGPDTIGLNYWRTLRGKSSEKIYVADWERYGKAAGFIRNVKIIKEATFAAVFWTNASAGTLDDIGLLLGSGKPFNLYVR